MEDTTTSEENAETRHIADAECLAGLTMLSAQGRETTHLESPALKTKTWSAKGSETPHSERPALESENRGVPCSRCRPWCLRRKLNAPARLLPVSDDLQLYGLCIHDLLCL